MTVADLPVVFIVYDHSRMRAAMQRLLSTVGLYFESFATPEDFVRHKLPNGPSCLLLDFAPCRDQWVGLTRSSPPSRKALLWDWRSLVPLLNRMGAGFGRTAMEVVT